MGEQKRRSEKLKKFLTVHPRCVYCAGEATTIDHCPPRVCFIGKVAPEGFEFPACLACNQAAKRDELVVGVLARIRLGAPATEEARAEWCKHMGGLINNQPNVVREWLGPSWNPRFGQSRNYLRNGFRDLFGRDGDLWRNAGYGLIDIGPLTSEAMRRFNVKLGQALFYRHSGRIFSGDAYPMVFDTVPSREQISLINNIAVRLSSADKISRNNKELIDQFFYKYYYYDKYGCFFAIVTFNEQMAFMVNMLEDPSLLDPAARSQRDSVDLSQLSALRVAVSTR